VKTMNHFTVGYLTFIAKYYKDDKGRVGHVARMGEKRNAYKILVRRPETKRLRGRSRRKWEGNG